MKGRHSCHITSTRLYQTDPENWSNSWVLGSEAKCFDHVWPIPKIKWYQGWWRCVSFHDHHLFLFLDLSVPWRFYDGMWHASSCSQQSKRRVDFQEDRIGGQNWLLVRLAGHDEMTSKNIWHVRSFCLAAVGVWGVSFVFQFQRSGAKNGDKWVTSVA